jgi:hypothetical protein
MLPTVQGIYRDGKIELQETPANVAEETRVIVTFLAGQPVALKDHGIDEAQGAELRARLATFAEDWESPEMAVYDNYDAAKANL